MMELNKTVTVMKSHIGINVITIRIAFKMLADNCRNALEKILFLLQDTSLFFEACQKCVFIRLVLMELLMLIEKFPKQLDKNSSTLGG